MALFSRLPNLLRTCRPHLSSLNSFVQHAAQPCPLLARVSFRPGLPTANPARLVAARIGTTAAVRDYSFIVPFTLPLTPLSLTIPVMSFRLSLILIITLFSSLFHSLLLLLHLLLLLSVVSGYTTQLTSLSLTNFYPQFLGTLSSLILMLTLPG